MRELPDYCAAPLHRELVRDREDAVVRRILEDAVRSYHPNRGARTSSLRKLDPLAS